MGNTAGKVHHFQTALHIPARLLQRLAVLSRDEPADLFRMGFQQSAITKEEFRPLRRGRLRPGGEGFGGGLHDGVYLPVAAQGRPGDHLSGGGIINIVEVFGRRVHPFSTAKNGHGERCGDG